MYIENNLVIDSSGSFKSYERNNIVYYYTPIIFSERTRAGENTAKLIADQYEHSGKIDFPLFLGAFKVVICDNNSKTTLFFTDNSNQRCFFIYKNSVSDNFLEIIENNKEITFNDERVVEYLFFGKNHFDKTYCNNLIKSDSESYYVIDEKGLIEKKSKDIGNISNAKGYTAEEFSDILKKQLLGDRLKKNAISLTGGFDSRYVLSMINNEKLDINLYSTVENDRDTIISKQISKKLDKRFFLRMLDRPNINKVNEEQFLHDLFCTQNGYMAFFSAIDFAYNMSTFLKTLRKEGYELLFTGDTGVLHKDEHWQEEIYNYNNKKTNYNRFFQNRIMPMRNINAYTEQAATYIEKQKEEIKFWLHANKQEINTKSYDWYKWYLTLRAFIPAYYNAKSIMLEVYAPMLEFRFVANSYNLDRSERRFGKGMKKFITKSMPEVARIKTVLGTTTSSEKRYALRDQFYIFRGFFIKVLRFLNRKIFKKNTFNFNQKPRWNMEDILIDSEILNKAINYGIENNWIKNGKRNELDFGTISRLLEIYFMHENYLKK